MYINYKKLLDVLTLCHIKPNTPCIDDPRSSPEPCVRSGGSIYLNLCI